MVTGFEGIGDDRGVGLVVLIVEECALPLIRDHITHAGETARDEVLLVLFNNALH